MGEWGIMEFTRKSINGYRFYIRDGKYYVSNTSIGKFLNKEKLNDWRLKQALGFIKTKSKAIITDMILSEALRYPEKHLLNLADQGTAKHALMEKYLLTGERPAKSKWMDIFQKWEKDYNFKTKPSLVERALFNDELGVAGTADILGKVNGQNTLVDLKTSSGVYLGHMVQVCGYKLMIGKPMKVAILQISRDAKRHSFYILDEHEERYCTIIFKALLEIFKAHMELNQLGLDSVRTKMVYYN